MRWLNFIQKILGYKDYEILICYTNEAGDVIKQERIVNVKARNVVSAIEKAHMIYLYPEKGTLKIQSINGMKQEELDHE